MQGTPKAWQSNLWFHVVVPEGRNQIRFNLSCITLQDKPQTTNFHNICTWTNCNQAYKSCTCAGQTADVVAKSLRNVRGFLMFNLDKKIPLGSRQKVKTCMPVINNLKGGARKQYYKKPHSPSTENQETAELQISHCSVERMARYPPAEHNSRQVVLVINMYSMKGTHWWRTFDKVKCR